MLTRRQMLQRVGTGLGVVRKFRGNSVEGAHCRAKGVVHHGSEFGALIAIERPVEKVRGYSAGHFHGRVFAGLRLVLRLRISLSHWIEFLSHDLDASLELVH